MKFDLSRWESALEREDEEKERERLRFLERSRAALKQYLQNRKVKKAYLAGSILQAGRFYPFSDIDIAVEGLNEEYLKTLIDLEELLGREVDLIELEQCRFRDSIERRGLRIL